MPIEVCTISVPGYCNPSIRDTILWDPESGMLLSAQDDGRPIEYPVTHTTYEAAIRACATRWGADTRFDLQWIRA